jgi:transaldolase
MAYGVFQEVFSGERWERLAERGARPQRVLWASTSTKSPAYRDVRYVEELIGPHTVNTMPPATLQAFLEHGYVRASLSEGLEDAQRTLDGLRDAGIDMAEVTEHLLTEGVKAFAGSYNALITAVAARSGAAVAGAVG